MPITAGTRWYLPMNACTILVNTCHPYPIGDVIPRERLRSSGIDGIFKRAPNARIRKVAGVVTGSNGIPLPTVNLMPIAQTAAYLNSSSALLMGHFFLPPPPPPSSGTRHSRGSLSILIQPATYHSAYAECTNDRIKDICLFSFIA